jgi:hypothetical protein
VSLPKFGISTLRKMVGIASSMAFFAASIMIISTMVDVRIWATRLTVTGGILALCTIPIMLIEMRLASPGKGQSPLGDEGPGKE